MEFIKQTKLSKTDKREIFDLWNNEYPKKLNYKLFEEFEKYLENLKNQSHILMRNENQNIKGWYFDFIREKRDGLL